VANAPGRRYLPEYWALRARNFVDFCLNPVLIAEATPFKPVRRCGMEGDLTADPGNNWEFLCFRRCSASIVI